MKSRRTLLLLPALAAFAGCSAARAGTTLGAPPPAAARVTAVHDLKAPAPAGDKGARAPSASMPVVLKGTMIEKCPVAGCWFMLRDKSGVVRVDTKAAGFTVTDVPVNTEVTVAGTVKATDERIVAASGLSY